MTHHVLAIAGRPGLVLALLPLLGGCMVHARGTTTATMTHTMTAQQPVVVQTTPVVTPQPIIVASAPPPQPIRVVVNPAPRPGFVWIAGHHVRSGASWAWRSGHYVTARAGHTWVAPRYHAARGVWIRGHWASQPAVRVVPRPRSPRRAVVHVRPPTPRPVVRVRPAPPRRAVVRVGARGRVVVRHR